MVESGGEVYDLGYQHYDGPREGRMRARLALWTNGIRTALGIGRGGRAKILPIIFFVASIGPALLFVLIASTGTEDLPGHEGYYQIVSIILLLFSAIIAPELLCPDRRDGVISLYLVRPLSTMDYVGARWLAFFSVTLTLVYFGQAVLLIGFTLASPEPFEYLRDNWLDVPRILAAGIVVAAFTTTLPLAVSAFTTRRAYAAAFVIGLYFISASVTGALTELHCPQSARDAQGPGGVGQSVPDGETDCTYLAGDATKWIALGDIGQAPLHVNDLIFSAGEDETNTTQLVAELPVGVPLAWYGLLTIGPALILALRYRRLGA